jgi:hypothetical protein
VHRSYSGPHVRGQVEAGNIDLSRRPIVHNKDGSVSTVRSFSVNVGPHREVLLPSVVGGRVVSIPRAIKHYRQTGEHLGVFDSPADADRYAVSLHNQQAVYAQHQQRLARSLVAEYMAHPDPPSHPKWWQGGGSGARAVRRGLREAANIALPITPDNIRSARASIHSFRNHPNASNAMGAATVVGALPFPKEMQSSVPGIRIARVPHRGAIRNYEGNLERFSKRPATGGLQARIGGRRQDPRVAYNAVDDAGNILGSVEMHVKRGQPVLHMPSIYVNPAYRNTRLFQELMSPALSLGRDITADVVNPRLLSLAQRMSKRGGFGFSRPMAADPHLDAIRLGSRQRRQLIEHTQWGR